MAAKIKLPIVESAPHPALIIKWDKGAKLKGTNPEENVVCGACGQVFAEDCDTRDLHATLTRDGIKAPILIQCGACSALNSLRGEVA